MTVRGDRAKGLEAGGEAVVAAGEADRWEEFRLREQLARLKAENAELAAAKREVDEALEQRTRRVDQLLGERAQLERRLARAEAALQRVNRELGALEGRRSDAAGASALRRTFVEGARGLVSRVKSTFTKQPPQEPESKSRGTTRDALGVPAGDRSGALVPFVTEGRARPIIVVLAFGLAPDQRSSVLDTITRYAGERGAVPVVLTDDDDFAPLRSRRLVFEYFPPPSVRAVSAPDLEWDVYLRRRLALIRRKWQPARIVAFGRCAAGVAELWKSSPFEDAAIAELFASPPVPAPSD